LRPFCYALAVARTVELPNVRRQLQRDAIETRSMTSAEITRYMTNEIAKWTPVAKRVVQQSER
jgi:tripartite-type tricarboxylate transporter receptor subunit TctC